MVEFGLHRRHDGPVPKTSSHAASGRSARMGGLAYFELEGTRQIWTVPLQDEGGQLKAGAPKRFTRSSFNDTTPSFSPDGRWLAYQSNQSGTAEVYVRAFPPPASGQGGRWLISNSGGATPCCDRLLSTRTRQLPPPSLHISPRDRERIARHVRNAPIAPCLQRDDVLTDRDKLALIVAFIPVRRERPSGVLRRRLHVVANATPRRLLMRIQIGLRVFSQRVVDDARPGAACNAVDAGVVGGVVLILVANEMRRDAKASKLRGRSSSDFDGRLAEWNRYVGFERRRPGVNFLLDRFGRLFAVLVAEDRHDL
jgi:hypothetical protein